MGTVHKFKPPPKNQNQFRGYRPRTPDAGSKKRPRLHLRGWQGSTIAWFALVLVAAGIWAVRAWIGNS